MNIQKIKENVVLACKQISDTESGVWNTTEWNICSHLRGGFCGVFPGYNIDVELIKDDGRRPDIVIHKRGNNSDNLVVFQAKKDPTTKDIQDDLDKINETFFNDPYNYKFGVFISIGKLPNLLPQFDKNKIGIVEVYGWILDDSKDSKPAHELEKVQEK